MILLLKNPKVVVLWMINPSLLLTVQAEIEFRAIDTRESQSNNLLISTRIAGNKSMTNWGCPDWCFFQKCSYFLAIWNFRNIRKRFGPVEFLTTTWLLISTMSILSTDLGKRVTGKKRKKRKKRKKMRNKVVRIEVNSRSQIIMEIQNWNRRQINGKKASKKKLPWHHILPIFPPIFDNEDISCRFELSDSHQQPKSQSWNFPPDYLQNSSFHFAAKLTRFAWFQ